MKFTHEAFLDECASVSAHLVWSPGSDEISSVWHPHSSHSPNCEHAVRVQTGKRRRFHGLLWQLQPGGIICIIYTNLTLHDTLHDSGQFNTEAIY